MKDQRGAEARVDERCWYAIQTIMKEPSQQGNDSVQYLEGQMSIVDPMIAAPLGKQLETYKARVQKGN